jgi:hypothetical protein
LEKFKQEFTQLNTILSPNDEISEDFSHFFTPFVLDFEFPRSFYVL